MWARPFSKRGEEVTLAYSACVEAERRFRPSLDMLNSFIVSMLGVKRRECYSAGVQVTSPMEEGRCTRFEANLPGMAIVTPAKYQCATTSHERSSSRTMFVLPSRRIRSKSLFFGVTARNTAATFDQWREAMVHSSGLANEGAYSRLRGVENTCTLRNMANTAVYS